MTAHDKWADFGEWGMVHVWRVMAAVATRHAPYRLPGARTAVLMRRPPGGYSVGVLACFVFYLCGKSPRQ